MAGSITELAEQYDAAVQMLCHHHQCGVNNPYALEDVTRPHLRASDTWFVSGISGSGKTTITKMLEGAGYARLKNVLTRARRPEETDRDNIFIDTPTFVQLENDGALYDPHITNGTWHALQKSDVDALVEGSKKFYVDKSVRSTGVLLDAFPTLTRSTFVYVLPPSFEELWNRISTRERGDLRMPEAEIRARPTSLPEIADLKKTIGIPYAYVVNDTLQRVQDMFIETHALPLPH